MNPNLQQAPQPMQGQVSPELQASMALRQGQPSQSMPPMPQGQPQQMMPPDQIPQDQMGQAPTEAMSIIKALTERLKMLGKMGQ